MRKSSSQNVGPIMVGALLLVPLGLYLTIGHRGRQPWAPDRAIMAVATSVQYVTTQVQRSVSGTLSRYVALRGAREEANICARELAATRADLNAAIEGREEAARLRALLGYTEELPAPRILARIIGSDATALHVTVRIDRGGNDGVRPGMAVVGEAGVFGSVVRAFPASSDVMLLMDAESHLGAIVQRSRVRGSIQGGGEGEPLKLKLVRREDDIREGDRILTSGTDGTFPKGLVIGTVSRVSRTPTGMFVGAEVAVGADFSRAEELLVLQWSPPPVPGDKPR